MTERALRILEYKKIIELLKNQAGSEMTQKVISELAPFDEENRIKAGIEETTEGVKLIVFKGPLPLGNFYDISSSVELAKKGGTLLPKQLLRIYYNLMITKQTVNYMKEEVPNLPIICGLVEVLSVHGSLQDEIDRCILSEDEISDNASHELKTIRRSIKRKNEEIRQKLNQLITSSSNQAMLQDTIVTMRDGRYFIPVKIEHSSKFPGIVHDQSAKGATVFIEPQAVVYLNNQLRELEGEEKEEIQRILKDLSERVAEHSSELKSNIQILLHLDFIMAKAKLSQGLKCEEPTISSGKIINLKEARHPLIPYKEVVPTNVKIGGEYSSLIITGPNTGGKTVTLKTVGLLSMMAQTGLHIPAHQGSTLPVFTNIFADIGDEQSIEQSLSTFSSHMKNIIDIVDKSDEHSLVLVDELGAGTDPTEGAALAISILENLKRKGATIMATTHYTELKKYALSTKGIENASMEFNVETLSPTYKLTIGIPGKSNAFDISEKLGLEKSIITEARTMLSDGALQFEEVITAIEEDKKKAEEERDMAIAINIAMKKQKEDAELELKRAEVKKEEILNKAKEEARQIIKEAQNLTKEVQSELKELAKIESLGERNKKLDNNKRRVKDAAGRYREKLIKEVNDNPVTLDQVKVGDRVKVLTLSQNGEVIGLPDNKGDIMVQVGIMKVKVNFEDLKLITQGAKKKKKTSTKSSYGSIYKNKTSIVSPSLTVRGMNLDEALFEVSKYIDDVSIAGLKEVTIIHGRGEGILKKGIHQALKKNKQIKSFRKGEFNEGGDGVTVVEL